MHDPGRTRDLPVGIVGLGTAGRTCAEVLSDAGCSLIGTDADPDLRERFEDEFGVESYETPSELYETDVNAIVVTAPPKYHERIVRDALDEGLHVFIENPMADSLESAERIADAAAESDQVCMVNFGYLLTSEVRILRSYVEAGLFGDLMHVDVTHSNRRFIPRRGSWYTSESLSGGGVLMDRGTYPLGIVLHLNDWPAVERVMATTRSEFGNRQDYTYLDQWGDETSEQIFNVEDSVQAMVEFENGCTASISLAWAFNQRDKRRHEYEISGTDAGATLEIFADDEKRLSLNEVRDVGEDHYLDASIETDESPSSVFENPLSAFISGIETGTRPDLGTPEQALAIHRLVDRIYEDAA